MENPFKILVSFSDWVGIFREQLRPDFREDSRVELKRRRQDGLRPGHASRGRARMRCWRQYDKPRQQFTNKEI